ncbi:MAG: methyltransferase domain-containing protein [Planctomycetes bacterium]|nr:methyltransferase domain-containing protein [Planctomycetota bacterium]
MDTSRTSLKKLLQGLGYRFGKTPDKVDLDLARVLDRERFEKFVQCLRGAQHGTTPVGSIYECFESAEEANLFASRQADLTLETYLAIDGRIAPDLKPGMRVVDLGCWTGGLVAWLAACHTDCSVVGVDRVAKAVEFARAGRPPANTSFAVWDYAATPAPPVAPFDLLVSCFGIDFAGTARERDPRTPLIFALDGRGLRESPGYRFRRDEAAPYFVGWRRAATAGAVLWAVLRIPSFEKCLAVVDAAQAAGWSFEPVEPATLAVAEESFPILRFRAEAASAPIDPDLVLSWWVGAAGMAGLHSPMHGDTGLLAFRSLGDKRVQHESERVGADGMRVRKEVGIAGPLGYMLMRSSHGDTVLVLMPRFSADLLRAAQEWPEGVGLAEGTR